MPSRGERKLMTNKNNKLCYFGDCPECSCNDGYLNIFKANWMVCHEHKKRWLVGEDLFSTWRYETEEDWKRNFELIKGYEEVEPLRNELIDEEQRLTEYELKYCPIDTGEEPPSDLQ